jgi:hypothetical protein
MPFIAYNLTVANVTLAASHPPVILPASLHVGVKGPGVNVTSEARPDIATVDPDGGVVGGLLAADYVLLQAQVAAGQVVFEWTSSPQYLTSVLTIGQVVGAEFTVGPFEEFRTISAALLAADGVGTVAVPATIFIKNGNYTENLTLVDNVKLLGEPGGNINVTGTATATVPALGDWGCSFHNINFFAPGATQAIDLDGTAGAAASRIFAFRNCNFSSSDGGGSLVRLLFVNSEFYDCNLGRTVPGSDLIFSGDGSYTCMYRCRLSQTDAASMAISTAGSGLVYSFLCVVSGAVRSIGTGGLGFDYSLLYGGTGAVSAVDSDVGTHIDLTNCSFSSSSTRARKTFVGTGEIYFTGCSYASDVFFVKNPASTLVQVRDSMSSDLEKYSESTTGIISENYTKLLPAAGTLPNSITDYYMNVSVGEMKCNNVLYRLLALSENNHLIGSTGTPNWAKSYTLTGTAAAALADATACEVAVVVVSVAGTTSLRAVFSDASAGVPVKPTPAQVSYALEQAGVYGSGTIIGYMLLTRVGAAVNPTFTNPASDDTLAGYRQKGTVFSTR